MQLIEIQAHGRTYFINPDQITHAEGNASGSSQYIQIWLNEVKDGTSSNLHFMGDDARSLYATLHSLSREVPR